MNPFWLFVVLGDWLPGIPVWVWYLVVPLAAVGFSYLVFWLWRDFR